MVYHLDGLAAQGLALALRASAPARSQKRRLTAITSTQCKVQVSS